MEDWNDQEKSLVSRLVPLYCDPATEYSQLGSLFLTDTDTAIKQLFHFRELGNNLEPTFSSKSLLVFFLIYSFLTCVTYGTAVPSGLFVPSLLQGPDTGQSPPLPLPLPHLTHSLDCIE
jgi:chloride channel 7